MGDVTRYIVRECRPFKPGEHTPTNAVAIMVDAEDYDAVLRVVEQLREAIYKAYNRLDGSSSLTVEETLEVLDEALAAAEVVLGKEK